MSFIDNRPNDSPANLQQPWATTAPSVASAYTLNLTQSIVKGRVTEFRGAVTLTVNSEGILIDGKAVPAGASYTMYRLLLGLIITELAMRRAKSLFVPWSDIDLVRLDSANNTGVFCYHLPEKPKAFISVGFKTADAATFNHLAQTTRLFAPNRMEEGKIKAASTTLVVLLVVFAVIMLTLIILATTLPGKP